MEKSCSAIGAIFQSTLYQCRISEYAINVLIDKGIRTDEDLSLTTTIMINRMFTALRDADTLLPVTEMEQYKISYLCFWTWKSYMRNLNTDPDYSFWSVRNIWKKATKSQCQVDKIGWFIFKNNL